MTSQTQKRAVKATGTQPVPAFDIVAEPRPETPFRMVGQMYTARKPKDDDMASFGRLLKALPNVMAANQQRTDREEADAELADYLGGLLCYGMGREQADAIMARVVDDEDELTGYHIGELLLSLSAIWAEASMDAQEERQRRIEALTTNGALAERAAAIQEQQQALAAKISPDTRNRAQKRAAPRRATAKGGRPA